MLYGKMMKYTMGLALAAFTVTICITTSNAADRSLTAEEKKEIVKGAKEKLDNTTWEIALKEMSTGDKREEKKDTLRFEGGRISSDELKDEGFSPTNYTVRIKGKDRLIWETMQTSDEKGIAFWRGEFRNGQPMRGVLSWHIKENKVKDYSFASDGEKKWGIIDGVFEAPGLAAGPEPAVEEAVSEETGGEMIDTAEAVAEETVSGGAGEMAPAGEGTSEKPEEISKSKAEPEAAVEEKPKKKRRMGLW